MRPEKLRAQLKEAYRRLLNPLIRILIRNGVTATEAMELVKRAYVDAATSDEFQLQGQRITETRIAILTGLTRKEVQRLREEPDDDSQHTILGRIGRLIAAWNQDPEFTGPYGLPLAIRFDDQPGSEAPSFSELVRRHCPDIAASDMLDELIRTGLADVGDDGLIRNSGRTYIPSKLDPASIERLGTIMGRLADTMDFNNQVSESSLGRYERAVVTDIGLTQDQYRQFNVFLRTKCQELLETLDNWLARQEGRLDAYLEPKEEGSGKKNLLMTGIGVFHFLDDKSQEEWRGRFDGPSEENDED